MTEQSLPLQFWFSRNADILIPSIYFKKKYISALRETDLLVNEGEMWDIKTQIASDQILDTSAKEKLIEYSTDHSVDPFLEITFYELLAIIWKRIITNEHSSTIKQTLNFEITKISENNLTSKLTHLLNCLYGFDPIVEMYFTECE